ncbi:ferredoxin [Mycobacterium sp. CBMA271]|nr:MULTISPECIES: ferredoxin [unclassified Mycobacteroides]MUM23340.1 ferredoxin [Mycobacteroides sp. CBMA 271]
MGASGGDISITVDQDLCMGSGYCIAQHPDLFCVDEEGIAAPRNTGMLDASHALDAINAAQICPASAIEVTRGD